MTSFPRFFRFVAIAHLSLLCLVGAVMVTTTAAAAEPLKVGVVGLTHGHVVFSARAAAEQVQRGVAEADPALAAEYAESFGFAPAIAPPTSHPCRNRPSLKPWSPIPRPRTTRRSSRHARSRGLGVMLEKPLAISLASTEIEALLRSLGKSRSSSITRPIDAEPGRPFHDLRPGGHRTGAQDRGDRPPGPDAIGSIPPNSSIGLGDLLPVAGVRCSISAVTSASPPWLLDGERPKSVYCLNRAQPADYADVEDETTIILAYDEAVA